MEEAARRFESRRSAAPELVSYAHMAGRVLARDISADRDLPPFNRVAMDGFACRREDLETAGETPLPIAGTVAAGQASPLTVRPGTCIRVMTGAVLPEGAELVIKVESTETVDKTMRFTGSRKELQIPNFSPRGEDKSVGAPVLKAGTILSPKHAALLASVGISRVPVVPAPKIALLSTGDEVVEPESTPLAHQIRNANGPQTIAQLALMGLSASYYGVIPDDPAQLKDTFGRAAGESDLILTSGGVSMGDFDHAPQAMKENGFEILYDRVAVKPGKPTTFAVSPKADLFGMPGNPVSCFVVFEIVIKPYLYAAMGAEYRPMISRAVLEEPFRRRKSDREEWIPLIFTETGGVVPAAYHGSGHYDGIAGADGMALLPRGVAEMEEGSILAVRLF